MKTTLQFRMLMAGLVLALSFRAVSAAENVQAVDGKMTDQEGAILALVLRNPHADGGYTVVNPETRMPHMEAGDSAEAKQSQKRYIREHLQTDGIDLTGLIDQFLERNQKRVRLSIKSCPKDGYVIDSDDKDGGGLEKGKENRNVRGSTTVSLPVYDEKSGLVLVYRGTQVDVLAGSGWIILYKYEKGELKELKKVMVWIS